MVVKFSQNFTLYHQEDEETSIKFCDYLFKIQHFMIIFFWNLHFQLHTCSWNFSKVVLGVG